MGSIVTAAFLHHVAAFVIVGVLTAELVLLGGELTQTSARSLLRVDAAYGIAAAVLLIVGAGVWAFWLDPDRSCVEKHEHTVSAPAAAE